MSHGPHYRTSGHFALGQHAVERLNETSLNTNEVFVNLQQQQQEQAEAAYANTQIASSSKPFTQVDGKAINTKLYPVMPQPQAHEQIQLNPLFLQQFHRQPQQQLQNLQNHHQLNPIPLVYHQQNHQQQIPLIYDYNQQQNQNQQNVQQPQLNYFYQPKPQDVIYHQQPIVSMAQFQPPFLPPILPLDYQIQQQEQPPPQQFDNLLQVSSDNGKGDNSAATPNQEIAKSRDDESKSKEAQFEQPIIVNDDGNALNSADATIVVRQQKAKTFDNYQQQPQINVQILDKSNDGSDIESSTLSINGATKSNFQYLVANDQDLLGSTPSSQKEAPSRAFLRNFKKFTLHEHSTTTSRPIESSTASATSDNCCKNSNEVITQQRTISTNFLAPVHAGIRLTNERLEDCIDGHGADKKTIVEVRKNVNVKIVSTKRPPAYGDRIIFNSTPVTLVSHQPIFIQKTTPQPQILLQPLPIQPQQTTAVFHQPIVVEKEVQVPVDRPVYIKSQPETKYVDRPVYIKSPPEVIEKIVQQPIVKTVEKPVFIEKIVQQPYEVEKIVDRPVYIKSPPETKYVQHPVIVEKAVIKEIKVPVEKTVYVKSPPETRVVHQPVIQTVEKPVYIEKIVNQPYEVEKIVEKFIDRPVETIVEKPVIQTIEKIVEKPIYHTVEKPFYIEKIVDRPVDRIVEKPILQTVEKIVDRPIYQTVEKPVFIEKIVDRPIEKIVDRPVFQTVDRFIDRPYPVPYAVPFEKHIFHKPDFHVIAKAVPTKHKLFDFDALLRFLTKKEEVKHIYVPSTPQHQVNQLNKHQLIAASYTAAIEPIRESPLLDYSRYATSHLNPIKPVYGLPSAVAPTTLLKPIALSNPDPNPYAGN